MIQYYIQSKSNEAFTLLIDTTKAGTPVGFTIPVATGETYLYDVDWGDGITTANHTGSSTHTYAVDGVYEVRITGNFPKIYFNNGGDKEKLIKVLDWGEINYSTNQSNAFFGCVNLDFIATDTLNAWYNNIADGLSMFRSSSLTSLPDNMTLASLTNGGYMFRDNSLTSLPIGITLSSLTNGGFMFYANSLTSLPIGITLSSLTGGSLMFFGNTINTVRYSQLLIDMEANNSNNNVAFHGGNSKYNAAGETARNALIARGWTITDGGLEV